MSLSKLREPLSQYLTKASSRTAIKDDIWSRFGREEAVLVLDMAGFSITTRERGIIYYLAMIQEMQKVVEPLVYQFGGHLVKFESDNCFARFPDTQEAVSAATAIQAKLEERNSTCPDEFEIRISGGIDYGHFLLIEENEFYGDPVNCASKLGEDLADAGEILISRRAWERLSDPEDRKTLQYNVSNLQIEAIRH